jgi:hypothetical protein
VTVAKQNRPPGCEAPAGLSAIRSKAGETVFVAGGSSQLGSSPNRTSLDGVLLAEPSDGRIQQFLRNLDVVFV